MVTDVTPIFAEYIAGHRGPDPNDPEPRQPVNYGVVATLTDAVLEVELTFLSGSVYCCHEWGCHIALTGGKRWDGFRRRLAAHGIDAPAQMELRRACVIDEGAIFFDFFKPDPTRRGWYAFAPVAAQCYSSRIVEAPASAAG